jgi:hypothetical protein
MDGNREKHRQHINFVLQNNVKVISIALLPFKNTHVFGYHLEILEISLAVTCKILLVLSVFF